MNYEMKQFLSKEIPFKAASLYNIETPDGYYSLKQFLKKSIQNKLIKVRCFQLIPPSCLDLVIKGEDLSLINKLKGYYKEDESKILGLVRVYQELKPLVDIELNKKIGNAIARMYIEEWNMAINPVSQSVKDFFSLASQKDLQFLCIDVPLIKGIVGFYIHREPGFYKVLR